ncbi:MAG: PQQ-like beta-propeller repeat protein, partial [Dysgonamonadaceae bacterium]|nr:PQQ-like beta-propeller repeat protein [Dysgonamonadaceae bacterium]
MRFFFTLLIAFLTFSFGNGQNQTSFKDKKRITNEKLLSQSQSRVKMAAERPTRGKDLQEPNNSAVYLLQDAKLPVMPTGIFFETPATMKTPGVAVGSSIFYGYRLHDRSFYSFSADDPASATMINKFTDGDNVISGGELVNGDYYLTSCDDINNPANLIRLSTETWEVVSSIPVQQHALDMAYDYSTQIMYGITDSGTGSLLYTINLTAKATTSVGQLPVRFVGIAVHLNGTLFGVSITGDLYTINKTTGALNLVGATGISPLVGENGYYTQSIGFDHNTGKLYWAFVISSLEESGFYEIDITTGAATRKGFIGTGIQICALGAPYYSHPNIPAAPTGFTITPGVDGALSATL